MRAALPLERFRFEPAHIAHVAPAVRLRIGVDNLAIKPRAWHTEPITLAHDRRRVDRENDDVAATRSTHERDAAIVGVVEIDPLETLVTVVHFPERRLGFVDVV